MPRTKIQKPTEKSNKENIDQEISNPKISCKSDIKQLDAKFDNYVKKLYAAKSRIIDEAEKIEKELKLKYKDKLATTVGALSFETFLSNTTNSTVRTNKDNSQDEGYLTTESLGSIGKSKVHFSTISASVNSTFKTPGFGLLTKQTAIQLGLVTPKVKPNQPLTVLRRAQHGEMIISMAGSPVLVNSMVVEKPNVSVPLSDGRIISVQPENSIRRSEIPEIDEQTQRDLKRLRDNIDRIIEQNIHNSHLN